MILEGLAWVDEQPLADSGNNKGVYDAKGLQDDGKAYWFPSIMDMQGWVKVDNEDLALL